MTRMYISAIAPRPGRLPGRGEFVLTSAYGAVRVYTRRHINGCGHVDTNENHCLCPKWIYSKARGGQCRPEQQSAKTPSFAEACELAQKILSSFNPPALQNRQPEEIGPGQQAEGPRPVSADKTKEITRVRITLAACLRLDALIPYGMTDHLYPPKPGLAGREKTDDQNRRFDAVKKFLDRQKSRIELENRRLAALPPWERKAIRARLSTQIHRLP